MKQYKVGLLLLVGVFCLVLVACGKSGGSVNSSKEGESYELNLNFSASASSDFAKKVVEPWVQYVEEKSEGRIIVNAYSGAALGNLNSGYSDIEGGVYEAGFIIPGLHADTDMFPLTISDIPFLLQSPEIVPKVLKPYIGKYGTGISEDVTYLGVTSTDAYQIFGQKPIKSVADLKNKKISDSVAGRIELLKSLKGTPVSMANAELYESLERGITDYAIYTGVGAIGYKFDEVTKWMTKIDMGVSVMPFYINSDFLKSLPEDLQELMLNDLGPEFNELCTNMYSETAGVNIGKYEENVSADGGGVYVPTETEIDEWRTPIKKQMEDWVTEANKRGYDGQAMMDYYVELLTAEGVPVPQ
ncbi:TRAP transporter substrate-binding protein DctP [Peribacillus sp. NPDC097264]|uniref:TRAP transporter substrate-binding protein DctP n=1 Tax=Peribacillus sp. NPDC097264 TaxID=3390616 RepID=UPI003D04AF76